jgi:hypothetical protein
MPIKKMAAADVSRDSQDALGGKVDGHARSPSLHAARTEKSEAMTIGDILGQCPELEGRAKRQRRVERQ